MNNSLNLTMSYKSLPNQLYDNTKLPKIKNIKPVIFNEELAKEFSLPNSHAFSELFNEDTEAKTAIAQAYGGHQYGHFRVLGDGRAMLLGEISDKKNNLYDIHLKGSGRTLFSREGDGKATLSSMLREYIASESMHHLGVPSTRSLGVFATGEVVLRNTLEPGGILFRIAKSHIRVGTFQLASQLGKDILKSLADYAVTRHFPHIEGDQNKYLSLFEEILNRQAYLIAKWQSIGFVHGVMNTDNVLISGETIDYGPFAFLNEYDEDAVFSSIDNYGRYKYSNQINIIKWNLARLGEALIPLSDNPENFVDDINAMLDDFDKKFDEHYYFMMKEKLGISDDMGQKDLSTQLVEDLIKILKDSQSDYSQTFVRLSSLLDNSDYSFLEMTGGFFNHKDFPAWKNRWLQLIDEESSYKQAVELMRSRNPVSILRNSLLEKALDKAVKGDMTSYLSLLKDIQNPFDYSEIKKEHSKPFTNQGYKTYCGT